jgi:hypothetical protein
VIERLTKGKKDQTRKPAESLAKAKADPDATDDGESYDLSTPKSNRSKKNGDGHEEHKEHVHEHLTAAEKLSRKVARLDILNVVKIVKPS